MSTKRMVANINLSAIEENIDSLYQHMPVKKPIMAVIKADGYGHGSAQIAKHLEKKSNIYGYAVATAEEALNLRRIGLIKPILILGYSFEEDYEELIKNDITLTIFDSISANNLNVIAKQNKINAKIHLKVDTGMSRIGVQCNEEGLNTALIISSFSNLIIDGIFTHFARADEIDLTSANLQLEKFNKFIDLLKGEGIEAPNIHCANSAAILQLPDSHITFVRAGAVMYGLWPSNEMMGIDIKLRPAMEIKSHVVHIKTIEKGTAVSYGGTFVADRTMKVATIPVGYADGYPRLLSNKGYVLINGQKAPIVGRVCMDQFMVDVSDISVELLDEVTILGKSGDLIITAEEIGDMSGRFNYEFVCDISPRVPRKYIY